MTVPTTTWNDFASRYMINVGGGGKFIGLPGDTIFTCEICGAQKNQDGRGGGHGGFCPNSSYPFTDWIGPNTPVSLSRIQPASIEGEKGT